MNEWSDRAPRAGDVALVYGGTSGSRILVLMQRLVFRHHARFSHVLMCIGGGMWIEAMPRQGVHLITSREAFADKLGQAFPFEVIRPPFWPSPGDQPAKAAAADTPDNIRRVMDAFSEVGAAAEIQFQWLSRALYYVGQSYNFYFLLPKLVDDRTKFCSELIAAIMRDQKIPPFAGASPSFFAPADLQLESLTSEWDGWTRKTDDLCDYLRLFLTQKDHDQDASAIELTVRVHRCWADAVTDQCRTHAAALNRTVAWFNLKLNSAPLEEKVEVLHRQRDVADAVLGEATSNESIGRGAPWIAGPDYEREHKAALDALKRAIGCADKVLGNARKLLDRRRRNDHGS